jgi:mannose-binding lectin 1
VFAHDQDHNHEEPGHLSLPNLMLHKNIDDLALNWKYNGDVKLDTGRLISQNGEFWSIAGLPNTGTSWTVEFIFRSTGTSDNDLAYISQNGLSFWLVNDIDAKSTTNFGGPDSFDGFQFLINNHQQPGLKVFNNDGSKKLAGDIDKAIGSCKFQYLDSLVPFTIRISYSAAEHWFKVQVDNNLCFKTNRLQIPTDGPDFKFGFTTSSASSEVWEIFNLNVWSVVTSDAIDDHGLMQGGEVEKIVNADQSEVYSPSFNRESLMERNRKYQEENGHLREQVAEGASEEVLKNLQSIRLKLDSIVLTDNNLPAQQKIDDVYQSITTLQKDFLEFKRSVGDYQAHLLNTVQRLNEKVISEVRDNQFDTEELVKKVDLLLASHKETSYIYEKQINAPQETPGITNVIIKWILIPVVIGVTIVIVFIYKLRHEIKHSKLL